MTLVLSPIQRFLAGACVALVAMCVVLGYFYWQNENQKADLVQRIDAYQATIDKFNGTGAPNDIYLTKPAFPAAPPNLDLASLILNSAAASGVTTGPLQAMTAGSDQVGTGTYRGISLNLTVTGTLPQVLNFYDRMTRGGIRTLVFDNMRLEPSNGQWTVTMQLTAYSQSG